jgi:putative membrane protein
VLRLTFALPVSAMADVAGAHVTASTTAMPTSGASDIAGAFTMANETASGGAVATACIVAALVLSTTLYALGLIRLWRAAAPGRGIRVPEVAMFCAGSCTLALALLGPLDAWAAHSFAAHMLQHETLMLIAAPLLVAGRPLAVWTWSLHAIDRHCVRAMIATPAWRATWRTMTGLTGATIVQLAALLLWHVPRFFDYAATHAAAHALQHTSFLASALCFWWAARVPERGRTEAATSNSGIAIACLFLTMLGTGALGALLTFAPAPWYHGYDGEPSLFASSALEDQQLGGLLMWVPGSIAYLIGGLRHAARLLLRRPSSWADRPVAVDAARGVPLSNRAADAQGAVIAIVGAVRRQQVRSSTRPLRHS